MSLKSVPSLRLALLAATALAACGGAHAQTAAPAGQEPVATVGEIIVTAQRRSERARDVPISIIALSAETLSRAGVTSTADLARVTPGLELPYNGGYLQPVIRGVTSAGSDAGDSSNVAMYVDGVYQASQPGQLMDLPDVQQVEVLKGPQGTLYGQNAEGGAIIITTAPPSFTPTGKALISYGAYNDVAVRAYFSAPITDTLAFSLSGSGEERDGFRKDIVHGGRDKGLHSKMARGKLLYKPTDGVSLTATAFYAHRADSSLYAGYAYKRNSLGYFAYPNAPYPSDTHETATSLRPNSKFNVYGMSLRGEFDVGGYGTLNTVSAYTHTAVEQDADVDYSPADIADVIVHQRQQNFSQEINFVSRKFGRATFTAGGFYLVGRDGFRPNNFHVYSGTLAPAQPTTLLTLTEYGMLRKHVAAAYAEFSYDLTDRLVVSLGGRYSYEKQHSYSNENGAHPERESAFSPATFKKFTPRVTARYALTARQNVYATYSKGFKSGILSVSNINIPAVSPEDLTAYEVGYKGQILDNLSLDLAAYNYNYKNLQVARYVAPDYIYQNAASARIRGVDVDATYAPAPELTLRAGASFLDGKYRRFPQAGVFVPNTNPAIPAANLNTNIDASGARMIRTPKITATVSADYRVETAVGRFGAYGSLYYNDGYKLEVSGRVSQPAYTTADAELSFSPAAAENLRLVLWGKNLGDKARLQSILQTSFGDGVSYQPPRTFGVRAELQF
jgi:iron complex outermembrane receptor protein